MFKLSSLVADPNATWTSVGRKMIDFLRSPYVPGDPQRLKRTLIRLVFGRVLLVTAFLAASTWSLFNSAQPAGSMNVIFGVLAATYALSVANVIWVHYTSNLVAVAYGQGLTDVLLASGVIYATGGTGSPFVVLYLLIIAGSAMVVSSHGAVVIAAACGIGYAVISSGALPSLGHNETSVSAPELFGLYFSLVGIAVLSSYLARQIEAARVMARTHADSLTELSHHQQQLFDDLSEGIITLDRDTKVSSINRAGMSILGLSKNKAEQMLHKHFPTTMSSLGVEGFGEMLKQQLNRTTPSEVCIKTDNQGGELCISYHVRPLVNSAGEERGMIMLFNDISHLKSIEQRLSLAEQMTKLLVEEPEPSDEIRSRLGSVRMIGESPVMKQVMALVERVAASDASVLITGESGTGKELIAKAIHVGGDRASGQFVAINCGAIPENLIESELFGHKKGSFTGAHADKPGLFRQANGGTIFLDEVGELPLHLQTKLLRVLQEKVIRPVGDVHDYQVDVRVISATNRDLKSEIAGDRFREDLYYRLNVVNIVVPPLRERKEDIPLLVRYFIGKFADPNKVLPQVSPEAIERLTRYGFPGNIRELENIIERTLVLGGQAILPEHLPDEVKNETTVSSLNGHGNSRGAAAVEEIDLPIDLENILSALEQEYLLKALEESGGVKKQAAELLGLNFRSFRYRLKKYGLNEQSDEETTA